MQRAAIEPPATTIADETGILIKKYVNCLIETKEDSNNQLGSKHLKKDFGIQSILRRIEVIKTAGIIGKHKKEWYLAWFFLQIVCWLRKEKFASEVWQDYEKTFLSIQDFFDYSPTFSELTFIVKTIREEIPDTAFSIADAAKSFCYQYYCDFYSINDIKKNISNLLEFIKNKQKNLDNFPYLRIILLHLYFFNTHDAKRHEYYEEEEIFEVIRKNEIFLLEHDFRSIEIEKLSNEMKKTEIYQKGIGTYLKDLIASYGMSSKLVNSEKIKSKNKIFLSFNIIKGDLKKIAMKKN